VALAAGSAAGVPVLVGTTRDEMRLFSAVAPDAFSAADDDAVLRKVAAIPEVGPDGAAVVVAAYRRRWPHLTPTDLHVTVHTDHAFRRPAQRLASLQAPAGAWMYWFTWASPILGGWLGSYHGLEIPFVFDNLGRPNSDLMTGGGDHLQQLADAMAGAWLAFARDGDPGWPAYDPAGDRATMRFDLPSEVVTDPDPDLRRAWESIGL
jgi:para-nitrobenzyl esterase